MPSIFSDDVLNKLSKRALEKNKPFSVMIELTSHCNLRCKMCAFRCDTDGSSKNDFSVEEWIHLGLEMRNAGVVVICMTGGDPLYYEQFEKVYRAYTKMGFCINIKTNATLIDQRYEKLFQELPPKQVLVTLYGGSPETYENVTGNRKAFSMAMNGLSILKRLSIFTMVSFTLLKDNAPDFHKVEQIANQYSTNRTLGLVSDIYPHIQSDVQTAAIVSRLSPSELVSFEKYRNESWDSVVEHAKRMETLLDDYIPPQRVRDNGEKRVRVTCMSAATGAHIRPNKMMTLCANQPLVYSIAIIDGFTPTWETLHEKWKEFSMHSEVCVMCKWLKYCKNHCPFRMYSETGNCIEPSEYICKQTFLRKRIIEIDKNRQGG